MPTIELAMTSTQFTQLPRNAAYRYEYLDGKAYLQPLPKHYQALLNLKRVPIERSDHRPIVESDWKQLSLIFSEAFRTVQPFGSLEEPTRLQASQQALDRTRFGGDGIWSPQVSFVAYQKHEMIGAILITLLQRDSCEWVDFHWQQLPPADAAERSLGRPHLTWIFLSPRFAGRGVGTALLQIAANALLDQGFTKLLSTFILGNDASMLWHWRNGFQLLLQPPSAPDSKCESRQLDRSLA